MIAPNTITGRTVVSELKNPGSRTAGRAGRPARMMSAACGMANANR
jgi:hypothetical protein